MLVTCSVVLMINGSQLKDSGIQVVTTLFSQGHK